MGFTRVLAACTFKYSSGHPFSGRGSGPQVGWLMRATVVVPSVGSTQTGRCGGKRQGRDSTYCYAWHLARANQYLMNGQEFSELFL